MWNGTEQERGHANHEKDTHETKIKTAIGKKRIVERESKEYIATVRLRTPITHHLLVRSKKFCFTQLDLVHFDMFDKHSVSSSFLPRSSTVARV